MSVYKEVLRLVQEIERRSEQIYPDSCDYGVRIESNEDDVIKELANVKSLFKLKAETYKYATGTIQQIVMDWSDEWGKGDKLKTTFTYVHINSKHRRIDRKLQGYLFAETEKI